MYRPPSGMPPAHCACRGNGKHSHWHATPPQAHARLVSIGNGRTRSSHCVGIGIAKIPKQPRRIRGRPLGHAKVKGWYCDAAVVHVACNPDGCGKEGARLALYSNVHQAPWRASAASGSALAAPLQYETAAHFPCPPPFGQACKWKLMDFSLSIK